jgi:hypothetical protein
VAILAEGNEMKTDNELNRLIAERVMGWTYEGVGRFGGLDAWLTPDGGVTGIRDYCTDPAAWGALFVWLAECGCTPMIEHDGLGSYTATVKGDGRVVNLPGRALVLATLAAYGVEVDE